jgi:hypothetical protein
MMTQSVLSNLFSSYIPSRTAQVGKAETAWKANMCFKNAYENRQVVSDALGREFKIVLGGLGFNGWFEFGHRNPISPNYEKKTADSHAWLESEDGFIIDFMFQEYADVMEIRDLPTKFPVGKVVMGTRKMLKEKYGLEFIPASKEIQAFLYIRHVMPYHH